MTNQENLPVPVEDTPQEVAPDVKELVETNMRNETAEVQQETMELFETIRLKAQSEMQKAQQEAEKASELTREAYLDAVRNVRSEVENMNVFDPERIEYTIKLMQMDAENNWEGMVKQFNEMGERLNDAAQAAWAALTSPRETYTEKEDRTTDESKQLD